MATISSLASILPTSTKFTLFTNLPKPTFLILKPTTHFINFSKFSHLDVVLNPRVPRRLFAVAEEAAPVAPPPDPSSEAAKRLYIGNIPRTVDNDELTKIVEEHGAVEKAEVMYDKYSGRSRRFAFVTMRTVEDANAVIEKLNGTQIGGREIKVNITEKPLASGDLSFLQLEESQFVDSPHKVYVGNLAKTVTSEILKNFFSEKGKVLSAKVSRVPGTSKSSGYGFVSFSEEEDVEAAISSFNNSLLEGQKIRVNKA
ncbi:30S ribosomal protein 2, chloroplastic isoform X2 [Ricinus communis]|uniref:Small ribosomal subunit protein cS22 n=1 Tax=Ricinus communis TaxID=3988 RepID=B9RHH4_RICCO|nr:30S ribosomal protein 2, chloroplastic isoform X2 [Ricinus communis]EEF49184.1 ribonucleoprotein, chloroplast, putative [Ricinus communis]|eukprot:XP_002513193.1 30S ribosomal protein 2, chloroplastic isoform X2 [Ricinus communis]